VRTSIEINLSIVLAVGRPTDPTETIADGP
jgi:hypothetical protein